MLDLLLSCPLLCKHIRESKVGLGINHEMSDYRNHKKKNLDLVLCRYTAQGSAGSSKSGKKAAVSFAELVDSYDIMLAPAERDALAELPALPIANVSSVLLAIEAKAAMTAFSKARPRLKDELTSSFQTIHGDSAHAIAAGLVMVNTSEEFISPDINKFDLSKRAPEISKHVQPKSALLVLEGLRELQRRSTHNDTGFDGIGVVLINCRNDGRTPVSVPPTSNTILPDTDDYHYTRFIERLATLYSMRFNGL